MNFIKKYYVLIPVLAAVLFTGCGNAYIKESVESSIKDIKIGGEFILHDNPQEGDYAVYKVMTARKVTGKQTIEMKMESTVRYEVQSVKKQQIIISKTTTIDKVDTFSNGRIDTFSVSKDIYTRMGMTEEIFYLNSEKMIDKVIFVNKENGIKKEYQKAEPGKEGYFKYSIPVKAADITTASGIFHTEGINCEYPILFLENYEDSKVKGYTLRKGETYAVIFVLPDVKFKKVKSESVTGYQQLDDFMLANGYGGWIPRNATVSVSLVITEELTGHGSGK